MKLSLYGTVVCALAVILVCAAGCTVPSPLSPPAVTPAPTATLPVTDTVCGVENCHGLEIQCGPHPAEVCTAMFAAGDQCRRFAHCSIVQGSCQPVYEPPFEQCRNCVRTCISQYNASPVQMMECQQNC
ncbi:MAG: hypothetical protein WC391_06455 [Methanoregula sp.]